MMRRIVGKHPAIFVFEELHFFEQFWSPRDKGIVLDERSAISLASKLMFVQRSGYLNKRNEQRYWEEASRMIRDMNRERRPHEIFLEYLRHECSQHGKTIPCQKTPQDVFYLGEIIELFPQAKIINMVRDPRGVLLSQKRKWRLKKMGASWMSKKEQWRLRINYHPVTISRLWNSAQAAAMKYEEEPNVRTVLFENLVGNPDSEVRDLCQFLALEFDAGMLDVPQVGSSNETARPSQLGIKPERATNWELGGLNDAEVRICQSICRRYMQHYGYKEKKIDHPIYALLRSYGYYATFPVKAVLALIMNLPRMKNVREAIVRRLTPK